MIVAGVRAQARRRLRDVAGMPRVEIRFDGVSRGAKAAAAETRGAIQSVGDQADKEEKRVSRFGSTIRSALVIGAKAAGAGVVALGGAVAFAGFKFDDLKQRANIAFTTMLGSGQKAQAFLMQLQKFAASTPFEFPQLIQTSQRLLAMGFSAKQVVPTLTAIGDAVAGLGGSPEVMDRVTTALGQIQAKGKVASEEMLQLTEAGIPAWQMLADKIGVSVPEAMKLVQARAVDSNVAIAALTEGMEKRFGGMMEKQSHTFSGLLSTVKDTFTQLAGTVMAPFFSMATKGLQKIVDVTSGPGFTAGLQRFGDVLSTRVGPVVRQVAGYIVEAFRAIAPIVAGVATAVWHYWQAIGPPILNLFRGIVRAVWPLIQGLASIIRATFEAIAKTINSHRAEIDRVVSRISAALGGISKVLQVVLLPIIRFVFTQVLPRAVGFAISALDKLTGAIAAIVGFFRRTWRTAADLTSRFFNWIVKTAINVALQVVEPFSHLPGKLGGWARDAKDALHAQLAAMQADATKFGGATGDAWGRGYYGAASSWLSSVGALAQGAAGATPGNAGAAAQGGGTAFGLVTTAKRLGVGSGGVGGTGGHGGLSAPGTAFDCSGYIYQVFTQTGFKGFPGTSETQWSTASGPNWTSERIPVSAAKAGDVVFMVGAGFAPPGHVGFISDGAGPGASVVAYSYKSGRPPSTRKLGEIGDLVGIKRFYLVVKGKTVTGGPAGGGATPAAAPKPKASAFSTPTDDLYGVTAGQLDTTTAGGGAAADAKKAATSRKSRAKAVSLIRDQVAELAGEYAKLPPAAQKIVAPKMAALRDELAHVTDDRTLAKARRGLTELKTAINGELNLQKSVQIIRDQAATVADAIGRLPAAARADLAPKMAALRAELSSVATPRDLTRVKADLQKIRDAVAATIAAMTEDVKQKRDAFSRAFGTVADKALSVFDAKTDKLLKAARVKFEGLSLGEGDLTAEERALADFQAARELDQRAKARAADVASRDALLVASADETADERTKRLADLADAEDKLRQDDLDDQERALTKAAELSRTAADAALELERERIQDERNLLRERFNGRLQEIETAFQNEKITAEEAQNELLGLLADPQYATDFASAGLLIGSAFATGFTDALGSVRRAVDDLRRSIDDLNRATGTKSDLPTIGDAGSPNVVTIDTGAGGVIRVDVDYAKAHGTTPEALAADAGRWNAIAASYAKRRAGGGKIPGSFVGLEDTVLTRLSPGENVIDRRLNAALERELLGGGGRSLAGATIYVLGTTEREVAKALERLTQPERDRTIGYSSQRA